MLNENDETDDLTLKRRGRIAVLAQCHNLVETEFKICCRIEPKSHGIQLSLLA
jgi:hypothetical protein